MKNTSSKFVHWDQIPKPQRHRTRKKIRARDRVLI